MENDMESPQINVLINLSSRLLCEGLQRLMKQFPTTYRTVVAHDPEDCDGFAPHKILVDAATLEHFSAHWHGAKLILIDTGLSEDELLRLLSQYRLDGVISTGTGADLFWKALEAIRDGQVWIDNGKIKSILHSRSAVGNSSAQESFSKREREIVLSIAEGHTNRQIAAQLNISEQTVKTHVSRILKKANVISRVQLGPFALKFKFQSAHLPHMNLL